MTKSGANISRRTSKTDCYSTPAWATEALLERERFPGVILEPCAGEGAIVDVFRANGLVALATDIDPSHFPVERWSEDLIGPEFWRTESIDFLTYPFGAVPVDHIVTNPAFSIAQALAERALLAANSKVAFFLRLQFLEGQKRYEWLKASPLKVVYVFSERVSLVPFGQEGRVGHNGTACHAWFCWDHSWEGEPVIRWIPPREKGTR